MRPKHFLSVFLTLLTLAVGQMWGATEYELMLTLDVTKGAPSGSTSTALTDATLLSYLQGAAPATTDITAASKVSGDVYKGKGSGGGSIPQACLKLGKASGPGSISFTIASTYDDVTKVEITGYGWKNTTAVSVNSSTAQTTTTAQSQVYTFPYEISATKTISIAVTSSAFCATEIKLYKTKSSGGTKPVVSFDPAEGTFCSTQSVTLSSEDGATIYYTTNGSDPTSSSSTYSNSSAISVSSTTTIKAFATKGGTDGDVVSATYTINSKEDPTITPTAGNVEVGSNLDVSTLFSSNSEGAVTYSITAGASYATIDGSTLTGVAAGSVTVQASQAADGCYNAKTATTTVTVQTALPKITIDGSATGITTTDGAQNITVGVGSFGGTFKQYSTTALWFTSGTGYIYNKASFGKIRKITINYKSGGAAAAYQWIKMGNSVMNTFEAASTNGVKYEASTGGSSNTFVVTGDYEYFCLSVSNKNLQATSIVIAYEEVKNAVTVATPATGTGTLEVTGAAALSAVSMGSELTVAAAPSATYHGGTVKVVKTGVTPEADVTSTVYNAGTGKLTMPDYAITVSATFVADAAISVAVAAGQTGWGTVKLYNSDPEEVSSGTTFKPSAEFIIEANPANGYEFDHWTKSAGSDITLSEADAADNDPTLTAGEVSTTFTATFRSASTPNLKVSPASLSFGPIAVNGSQEKIFELTGENLTADASLAITGTGAAMFSVDATVAKDGDGVIAEDVTVTYNPTAAGTHTATLTISSTGAVSREVALSGEAKTNHAITWSVNGTPLEGEALKDVTTNVLDGGSVTALPADPANNTLACANTFMGWSRHNWNSTSKTASDYDDLFKAPEGAGTIDEPTTFYAVFATVNNGSDQDNDGPSWERDETTDTYTEGYTFSSTASAKTGYYQDKSSGAGELKLYHTSTPIFSSTPKSVTLTASIGAGQNNTEFTNYVYAQLLDKDGNGIGNAIQVNSSLTISSASGDTYTPTFDLTDITSAYGVKLYHEKESGKNIRYYSFSLSFVTSGTTTTDYVTKCAAVAVPTFSVDPADGPFNAAQSVEISCATSEAAIYYTTNGSTPTSSSTLYEGPISVNESMTLKAIAIKGADASDVAEAAYELKVATPTISGTTAFLTTSEVTITATGADAIYYTDDDSDPASSGTRKTYSAPFTVDATTTIKAIATKTNWTNSAVASETFTKITPMTVVQAKSAIDAGGDLSNKYVKGIISQIDSYNSNYNSITYWISDDGTTTNQLEVYSGLAGIVKAAFESVEDLKLGEEVIVNGTLKKYSSTYEFDKNNTIVAIRHHSPLEWSTNAYTAELGGSSNVFPSLSGTAGLTVTYASSDETVATISADGTSYDLKKTGETTITASSEENASYVATSVSYTLTVDETVVRYNLSFEKNGGTSDAVDLTDQTNLPNPLPTITKAGYNFGGWYLESTFDNLAGAGDPLTGNTTLYAQWLDPYTVAEALTIIDALADNGTTGNVYVAGVVTSDAVTVANNVATYKIKDADVANSLEVYKGKGLNNVNVTDASQIVEGDQLVVYGQLQKYVKNTTTTPEFAQGNYIYSRVRPTTSVTGVTLPATAIVRIGSPITLTPTIAPSNATNKNVSWSVISGNTYAEVSDAGVVTGLIAGGDAVIQVETEDGGFTASCTVSVGAARPDFTEDDHEWIKITNASKLVAGKFYVIASEGKGKTAKNTITNNRLDQVASTFDDGRISVGDLGNNTAIFELGGVSGAWTLNEVTNEANTGLLSYNGDKQVEWNGTNSTWDISIEDGDATIAAVSASTERILYNNSSSWFTVYASATSSAMLLPQLYMWAELSHAVTFDANGGVAESVPGVERTDEGKITIPETEPTHSDVAKVFAGWYKSDAPGTLYNAGDEFATNVDVTLYAKWNTVPTYTVTYVPGGSGTVPDVASYPAGKKVLVETNVSLSNPGYSFTGWTVKDADQNVLPVDEDNKFTMPAKNVTIVAGWARISNQKWVLVENVDDLKTDGTKYIIAGAEHNVGMGALNGSIYNSVGITKDGKTLKGPEMTELTFEAGSEGKLAIKHGSKYVYSTSAKSIGERDETFEWTISISEGVATINAGSAGTLQYNSGNPRFTTYTSTQQPVAIYIKSESVVVSGNQNISGITAGSDVTVENGGVLTVNEDKSIGDLTVENGGKVVLSSNKLTVVGVFSIESTMAGGSSGQLTGATNTNFAASGEAYIDITLGAGATADQWHAFTVPFPVDAINGVFDLDGNKLNNEEHYAIMEYDGSVRAQGKYGWKKIRTTLVPGTFYLMTVDGLRTTFRFKKKASEAIVAANSKQIYEYAKASEEVEDKHAGWNGIGNPNLFYGKIDVEVQVLDPNKYVYVKKDPNSTNFVVGTPFFYQASADGWISMLTADAGSKYAPRREEAKSIEKIKVSFGNEEYTDYLDIWASEEALNKYQIGKDLVKMTMTNAPKVAQIFGNAYNSKLCMVYAPMSNDKAEYALSLYAPANGEYTIAAQQIEDAEVYLTKDGSVIWNISESAYTAEFTKGSTESYGLLMIKKTPQVTTGIDGVESSKAAQKLIIDQNVFILRGEKMYDVTGKEVK